MLFIVHLEAIESQRGIAWRCQERRSLRTFLKFSLNEATPDRFRLSKIGDRLPLEVYIPHAAENEAHPMSRNALASGSRDD